MRLMRSDPAPAAPVLHRAAVLHAPADAALGRVRAGTGCSTRRAIFRWSAAWWRRSAARSMRWRRWLWPPPVAVLLSTAAGIYLTGAFHEDGFADMCDGFGGGMTRERVLEIMKDSRIGAYGAIGIGCLLALKASLLALLPPAAAIAALLLAHPLSRLAAVALIWRLEYARAEGKAKPMAQEMTSGRIRHRRRLRRPAGAAAGPGRLSAWGAHPGRRCWRAALAAFWLGAQIRRASRRLYRRLPGRGAASGRGGDLSGRAGQPAAAAWPGAAS